MTIMNLLFASLAVVSASLINGLAIYGPVTPNPNTDIPAEIKEFLELAMPTFLKAIPELTFISPTMLNVDKTTVEINTAGQIIFGMPKASKQLAGMGGLEQVKAFLTSVEDVLTDLLKLFLPPNTVYTVGPLGLGLLDYTDTPNPVLTEQTQFVINATDGKNVSMTKEQAKAYLTQTIGEFIPGYLQDLQAFKDAIIAVNSATFTTQGTAILIEMNSPVPVVLAAAIQALVVHSNMLQNIMAKMTPLNLEIYVPDANTPVPVVTTQTPGLTTMPAGGKNQTGAPLSSGAVPLVSSVAALLLAWM